MDHDGQKSTNNQSMEQRSVQQDENSSDIVPIHQQDVTAVSADVLAGRYASCNQRELVEGVGQMMAEVALEKGTGHGTIVNVIGTKNVYNGSQKETGISDLDIMRIARESKTFVKTKGYKFAKEVISEENRVFITGAPGSGKTVMSLMLMKRYCEKHDYSVHLVKNSELDVFDLKSHLADDKLLVFDDIFGHFPPSSVAIARLTDLFSDLTAVMEMKKNRFKIIFNSRFDIVKEVENRLKEFQSFLFRPELVLNLTRGIPLEVKEKESVLVKHLKKCDIKLSKETIDCISELQYNTLGFPYVCRLFTEIHSEKTDAMHFFVNPFECINVHLQEIFSSPDQSLQAAVLMIMLIKNGILDPSEITEENAQMRDYIAIVQQNISGFESTSSLPLELSITARNLVGTWLSLETNGETDQHGMYIFAHPTIYDAVAHIVGSKNEVFVLQYCSLKFISERVRTVVSKDDFKFAIELKSKSKLWERLARELREGNIAMVLSHPSLKDASDMRAFVNLLDKEECLQQVIRYNDRVYGLSFLYWSSYTGVWQKGYLEMIKTTLVNMKELKLESLLGACVSGNEVVFEDVKPEIEDISNVTVGDILKDQKSKSPFSFRQICQKEDRSPALPSSNNGMNDTLIHVASKYGHKKLIDSFLDLKVDINMRGDIQYTPLMYACHFGHAGLIDVMLDNGADPTLVNEVGETCVHIAARTGFTDTVKILLQKVKHLDLNCRGRYDRTPIMYAAYGGYVDIVNIFIDNRVKLYPEVEAINKNTCLHEASHGGRKEVVMLLLEKGEMAKETKGRKGRTPVLFACRGGHRDIVQILADCNVDMGTQDVEGNNCLHIASMSGNAQLVKWLLDRKYCGIESKNNYERTPLMCAVLGSSDCGDVYGVLIEAGANQGACDKFGTNCLHLAAQMGNLKLVTRLLKQNFNINQRGYEQRTPIMYACIRGQKEVFEYLLEISDISLKDRHQRNCLHLACKGNNVEIVQRLLEKCTILIPEFDEFGNNALAYSVENDNIYLYNILLDNKISRKQTGKTSLLHVAARHGSTEIFDHVKNSVPAMDTTDDKERTVAMIACKYGQIKFLQKLLTINPLSVSEISMSMWSLIAAKAVSKDAFDTLKELGLPKEIKTEQGETPLHIACKGKDPYPVRTLLECGADILARDNKGRTPLHIACLEGSLFMVEIILYQQREVDIRDKRGITPLMSAMSSWQNNIEVIRKLLDYRADINAIDNYNNTCLHISAWNKGHISSVKMILDKIPISIDKKNITGNTPLMTAAISRYEHMVDLLIDRGANLALTNRRGYTAFHLACMSKDVNLSILKKLLKHSCALKQMCECRQNIDKYVIDMSKKEEISKLLQRFSAE